MYMAHTAWSSSLCQADVYQHNTHTQCGEYVQLIHTYSLCIQHDTTVSNRTVEKVTTQSGVFLEFGPYH